MTDERKIDGRRFTCPDCGENVWYSPAVSTPQPCAGKARNAHLVAIDLRNPPAMPPVVRLELPYALLLKALLEDVLGGRYQSVPVTNAQAVAVAQFQNRIREAESRS